MVGAWLPLAWLRNHVAGLGSRKKPALKCTIPMYIYICRSIMYIICRSVVAIYLIHISIYYMGSSQNQGLIWVPLNKKVL